MPNKVLKTLFLYNGIFVLGGSFLGPLYALYVEKLDIGVLPVSYSWAVFLLSATFFTYVIARIGDKFKNKRLLLALGYAVRGLCWIMMALITQIQQLMIIQFFLGLGEALGTPAFDAIFAEHLDKDHHLMDYSDWKVISNGMLVIGTLFGGYIVADFGFRPLLIAMAFLATISFVGILFSLKEN